MSLLEKIQAAAFVDYPHCGLIYHLRPATQADLLLQHNDVIAAVLPPNAADLLTEAAIKEAPEADRAEMLRTYQKELYARMSDPALQRKALETNIAFLCACTAAITVEGERGEVRLVATEAEQDISAAPQRLWVGNLPAGAIAEIGGAARSLSFGGEEARKRIRNFCGKPGHAGTVREDGPDVRPSPE